jgi:hypothetical protein
MHAAFGARGRHCEDCSDKQHGRSAERRANADAAAGKALGRASARREIFPQQCAHSHSPP